MIPPEAGGRLRVARAALFFAPSSRSITRAAIPIRPVAPVSARLNRKRPSFPAAAACAAPRQALPRSLRGGRRLARRCAPAEASACLRRILAAHLPARRFHGRIRPKISPAALFLQGARLRIGENSYALAYFYPNCTSVSAADANFAYRANKLKRLTPLARVRIVKAMKNSGSECLRACAFARKTERERSDFLTCPTYSYTRISARRSSACGPPSI